MDDTSVLTPGLENRIREHNCYVNAAVQILYALPAFRHQVLNTISHPRTKKCIENTCVSCALEHVFVQMAHCDDLVTAAHPLRRALAITYSHVDRFQMMQFDDAVDCLRAILAQIHLAAIGDDEKRQRALLLSTDPNECSSQCAAHVHTTLELFEQIYCSKCHHMPESQSSADVSISCLGRRLVSPASFIGTLAAAMTSTQSSLCQQRGCKGQLRSETSVLNAPHYLMVQLQWDTDALSSEESFHLYRNLPLSFHMGDVAEWNGTGRYVLKSMIVYYGHHYASLVRSPEDSWMLFDDATVKKMTSYSALVEFLCASHFMAMMVVYELREVLPLSPASSSSESSTPSEVAPIAMEPRPYEDERKAPNKVADVTPRFEHMSLSAARPASMDTRGSMTQLRPPNMETAYSDVTSRFEHTSPARLSPRDTLRDSTVRRTASLHSMQHDPRGGLGRIDHSPITMATPSQDYRTMPSRSYDDVRRRARTRGDDLQFRNEYGMPRDSRLHAAADSNRGLNSGPTHRTGVSDTHAIPSCHVDAHCRHGQRRHETRPPLRMDGPLFANPISSSSFMDHVSVTRHSPYNPIPRHSSMPVTSSHQSARSRLNWDGLPGYPLTHRSHTDTTTRGPSALSSSNATRTRSRSQRPHAKNTTSLSDRPPWKC